jgi:hypothetical protein
MFRGELLVVATQGQALCRLDESLGTVGKFLKFHILNPYFY